MSATDRPTKRKLVRVALASGAAAITLSFFGGGVALADHRDDQKAKVVNKGKARADSGDNVAIGNDSENKAKNNQKAKAKGKKGDKTAKNDANVSNRSNGSASIDTGDASASNENDTRIKQRN